MFSFQFVTKSVGCRRELVANSIQSTRQLSRVGVGSVCHCGLMKLVDSLGNLHHVPVHCTVLDVATS